MSENPLGPPDDFQDLVRDALLHMHDVAYLQTHPLAWLVGGAEPSATVRGKLLYRAIMEALEQTRPALGTAADSRAWRAYRILELRYVDGREASDVMQQVALSKNQYHRDHNRALRAVTSILWDRWRLDERWKSTQAAGSTPAELVRVEVECLEQSRQRGGPGRIAPAEVLLGVAELLRPLCLQRGVSLRIDAPSQLPPISGDRVALRQALLTVLARAVNATANGLVVVDASGKSGGVEVRVTLATAEAPHGGPVHFARRASAPGAHHLAGEGCRGETAAGQPDRLLGVEESRPFVDQLGGSVVCRRLPEEIECWEVVFGFPAADRPRLLVVDNSTDFIRLVERYLAGEGWEVVGAPDVDTAYSLVEQERVNAVLLDVVIPERDGWELLLALKANSATKHLPVIVCSVLGEPEVAVSLGAAGYLRKPLDKPTLVKALAPYLS